MTQAVLDPRAAAADVAAAGRQICGGQDAPVEAGRAPVRALRRGEDQPEGVGAGLLLGVSLLDPGGKAVG